MAASAAYIIDGGRSGADRLAVLDRVLGPMSEDFLHRAGLRAGHSCLDVGSGSGELTRRIARMAAPGEVVGIDADPAVAKIAAAATVSAPRYLVGDAAALPGELTGFDLVHARFLLSHLPDPGAALAAMMSACRPGGVVAVQDVDMLMFARPRSWAMDRARQLYCQAAAVRGADAHIGRRLAHMLTRAGVRQVRSASFQPAFREGEGKLLPLLTFNATRAAVLDSGLATDGELDEIGAELQRAVEDPETLIGAPRMHQVYGIRPG